MVGGSAHGNWVLGVCVPASTGGPTAFRGQHSRFEEDDIPVGENDGQQDLVDLVPVYARQSGREGEEDDAGEGRYQDDKVSDQGIVLGPFEHWVALYDLLFYTRFHC